MHTSKRPFDVPPLAPADEEGGGLDIFGATLGGVSSALVQNFGIGVRALRKERGWSQEQLAENSNLNRSYVSEIERGCVIASLLTVEKLASALKLPPSALVIRGERADV